jgi:hypothetical protein
MGKCRPSVFANSAEENWKKLHNGELHKLYSSPNILSIINSRMRWAGHVMSDKCIQSFGRRTLRKEIQNVIHQGSRE